MGQRMRNFEELIAFLEGVFGRADDSFDAGCVVEKIVSDSETGKLPFDHDNIFIGPECSDLPKNLSSKLVILTIGIGS